MKIALIAKKGGCGKSTIAILLHEAVRVSGQSVAVRDFDAQGSATKALSRIGGQREERGKLYQVLLIDTAPALSAFSAASATEADLVLVPCSPSPFDIWEADEAARFARSKNPKAPIRIVLNKVRAGTLLTGAAPESLQGLSEPVLPATLAERQGYQHALLDGWSALDARTRNEALQFTVAVTSIR
jgi:chromosome partitioning protein